LKPTNFIKKFSHDLGFTSIGIARAEAMTQEAIRLREWLKLGYHGSMAYMENHFDKRTDPTLLVTGAKSVIVLTYNYYTERHQSDPSSPKISKYAYGRDYHKVIKKKLKKLYHAIQEEYEEVNGRYFVDSAPVLERDWAARSGVGWVGKNTLVIHPRYGSYFFLATMIIDMELEYDHPIKDYCGTCTACIDACPTDAINSEGYLMDSSKCISYLTIELKDDIPSEFKGKMENWMYGCDICQEVCPWNRFSNEHDEPDFIPGVELLDMKLDDWRDLNEEKFDDLFRGSAVKRTKFKGLKRNIDFLCGPQHSDE
jgi:epoxyqueuosine reductase